MASSAAALFELRKERPLGWLYIARQVLASKRSVHRHGKQEEKRGSSSQQGRGEQSTRGARASEATDTGGRSVAQ
jgi:hypothetical protein